MAKLHFYKGVHSYKYGRKQLTSVTQFVGKFFKPFEATKIARKISKFPVHKAKKRGVRYWKAQWKMARERGTRVHNALDGYVRTNQLVVIEDEDLYMVQQGVDYLKENQQGVQLDSEKIIYDLDMGLAGTIDLIIHHKPLNSGAKVISLLDWKTSKKIPKKSYDKISGEFPLGEFDDCKYTHYQFQLCTYAYMLEKKGYIIKDLIVAQLTDKKIKILKVEYQPDIVKRMVEVHNENKERDKSVESR